MLALEVGMSPLAARGGLCIGVVAVVLNVAGCVAPVASCIPGTTQACLCTGGPGFGVQSCSAAGTYGACACDGVDGGPGLDAGPLPGVDGGPGVDTGPGEDAGPEADGGIVCATPLELCGGRCVDTSTDEINCGGCADATHTCEAGSFCVSSACLPVGSCPLPLLVCGGECIDPRTNSEYCGATGTCTAASDGDACGGRCFDGRCVYDTCTDAFDQGEATDGLYLLDLDGGGPLAPRDAYCDMTTAGGRWTLVYRIRNDIPDIADPWWPMVGLGSGDALPTARGPLPAGTHFDGPTREVRAAFAGRGPQLEIRATLLDTTGAVRLDVRAGSADALRFAPLGTAGLPTTGSCTGAVSTFNFVIGASPGVPLTAGANFGECFQSNSGGDAFMVNVAGGTFTGICGDASIGGNTTTLFWTRPFRP